jgi:hypothetical protein
VRPELAAEGAGVAKVDGAVTPPRMSPLLSADRGGSLLDFNGLRLAVSLAV